MRCSPKLIGVLGLALVLSGPAAFGFRSVPLPRDVRVVAPAPWVPPEVARFSGAWRGTWETREREQILVVEQFLDQEKVRVVIGVEKDPIDVRRSAGARAVQARRIAEIRDGTLRVVFPGVKFVFFFRGSKLAGTMEVSTGVDDTIVMEKIELPQ